MGGAAIFKGARTGLLSSKGLSLKDGSIVDNDGVPNFIKNGHAEINTTGWATYADTAGASPVDGTGGSANITWTRSTTTPLAGAGSFLFTKDAANRQGQGASYDFTVDPAFQARVINIQFDYLVSSGTFVAGTSSADSDVTVWIYDVTNSTLIQPSSYKLLSNSSTISDSFQSSFQTSATGTSYRLILHCGTTSASAYTLKLDNFQVTPTQYAFGTPVTDWVSWTPTGSWTSNTTYTGYKRRVGDSNEYRVKIALSGAPTSTGLLVNLPSTDVIDTAKLAQITGGTGSLGYGTVLDSGVAAYPVVVDYSSTTQIAVYTVNASATYAYNTNVTQAAPITFGASDAVDLFFAVPILGQSSSVQTSDQTSTRVVAASYSISSSTANSSFADNAAEVVDYDVKIIDTHNAVTTGASWKFTAPVSGNYRISANLSWVNTTNLANGILALYKNGAQAGWLCQNLQLGLSGTMIVSLNTGDYVDVRGFQDDSASAARSIDTNASRHIISIERISGPNQIAASETVSARGINSSGQTMTNGSFTVLQTPTILDNTHGALATNGEFTVPIAGRYLFGAYANTTSNATNSGDKFMSIFVDGIEKARGNRDLITSVSAATGISTTLICKAGEKVTARFYHNNGANRSLETGVEMNYFYAVKVGN